MAITSAGCDWTALPNDLLGLISERLSLLDCIRFRTVCIRWGHCRLLSRQSPLLMLPGDDGRFSDTCDFFSLFDKKFFRVASLPELRGKWWVGSADGWIVTLDDELELRLFNPLTRAQLQLPSITTTFPNYVEVIHYFEGDDDVAMIKYNAKMAPNEPFVTWPLDDFRMYYISKVVLSTTTTTTTTSSSSTIAIAIFNRCKYLAFAKAPYDKWMALETGDDYIEDVIYSSSEGKFYSLSFHSEVRAWDLSGPSPNMMTIIISEGKEDLNNSSRLFNKYLVESCGQLLQVWRRQEWHDVQSCWDGTGVTNTYTTKEVLVFKLIDSTKAGPKYWIPVNSLGDQCLFLGLSSSMSLSAAQDDIPGLIPNCIYFTDDEWTFFFDGHEFSRDLGVFNLEDGSFKPHYICNSQKNWPTPIWLTPNPFK